MAPIHINILNKPYAIECAPEDSARIHECADYINKLLRHHATGSGDASQAMVLTMIVMASEILEKQEGSPASPTALDPAILAPLTQRIKTVAKTLQDFQSEQR